MADDAKADLDEAMPALEAALDSLKALNKVQAASLGFGPQSPALRPFKLSV
jgi:hypothetical protein